MQPGDTGQNRMRFGRSERWGKGPQTRRAQTAARPNDHTRLGNTSARQTPSQWHPNPGPPQSEVCLLGKTNEKEGNTKAKHDELLSARK